MRRGRFILGMGIWVAVLPYLGFPQVWKNILLSLSGLCIASIGYALLREFKKTESKEKPYDNFRENSSFARAELSDDMAR